MKLSARICRWSWWLQVSGRDFPWRLMSVFTNLLMEAELLEMEASVFFQNLWVEEDKRLLAEADSRRWKTL